MEEPFGYTKYDEKTSTFSVDPVCGKSVNELQAPAKTGYAGQTYYFCSAHCQELFEQEPGRYIAAL
jgi:P-type Cu+ transporter